MKILKFKGLTFLFNALFVLFFIYILTKVDWFAFFELSHRVSYSTWATILLFFFGLYFSKALRVSLLNKDLSLWDSIWISSYHNFFLMLLPFKLGELAYVKKLKDHNIKFRKSVSDLIVLRTYDSFFILLLALFLIFDNPYLAAWYVKLFAIFVFLAIILFLLRTSLFSAILGFIPDLKRPLFVRIKGELTIILDMIDRLSPVQKMNLLFTTLLIWALSFAIWVVLLLNLINITVFQSLFATLVVLVASLVPINPPAGIGVTQGGWILGLALVGVDYTFALHFSLLANLVYVLSVTLIFVVVLVVNRLVLSKSRVE